MPAATAAARSGLCQKWVSLWKPRGPPKVSSGAATQTTVS